MPSLKLFDPFYHFFRLILHGFFKAKLSVEEMAFVEENITKHRRAMWVNTLTAALVLFGVQGLAPSDLSVITNVLISTVMILGVAWFAVSFGAVPAKLMAVSMSVTFWMFSGFLSSLSAMFLVVGYTLKPMFWPVLGLIYLATIIACVQYDTADGLKAGLDEAQLKLSRAALLYLKKQGIDADENN